MEPVIEGEDPAHLDVGMRDWGDLTQEFVRNPTLGDAILDRVVHRAHRIELKGPSLRKRHAVSPLPKTTAGA